VILRHPPGVELGAWFDGEEANGVGHHVARCGRCQRRLSDLARIRAWIRAQPFFAMADEPSGERTALRRTRLMLIPAVALLVASLLALDHLDTDRSARSSARALDRVGPAGPAVAVGPETVVPGAGPEGSRGDGTSSGRAPGAGRATGVRLGLIVPKSGPSAAEGAEVEGLVRRRVDAANAAGGVAGASVELAVVAAEDAAAVASLPKRVTALVGGFGSGPPPGATWVLPADPSVAGPNVVSIEPRPRQAGERMAEILLRQGLSGPIGVVVGPGPDSGLGDGLAARAPTRTVPAGADSNCVAEVAVLRRSGSVALAVAGPPDLALRCLKAAAAASWHRRFGTILAPSAAYARLESAPETWGAHTLLALPSPSAPLPGAARFRASTDSRSYRAMVSLAAVELAIEVARQHGDVTPAAVARGSWKTDLVDIGGGTARATYVVAGPTGWLPAPEGQLAGLPTLVPWLPPLPLP
jgi:hypothetical protein